MMSLSMVQNDGAGGDLLPGMIARIAVDETAVATSIARMNTRAVEGLTALTDDGRAPVYRTLQRAEQRTLPSGLGRRLPHARGDGPDAR